MSVTVYLHSDMYYKAENNRTFDATGKTVGECISQLVARYPGVGELVFDENGRLKSFVEIWVNRQASFPEGLEKPVNDGDEIHLLFMIAGG